MIPLKEMVVIDYDGSSSDEDKHQIGPPEDSQSENIQALDLTRDGTRDVSIKVPCFRVEHNTKCLQNTTPKIMEIQLLTVLITYICVLQNQSQIKGSFLSFSLSRGV